MGNERYSEDMPARLAALEEELARAQQSIAEFLEVSPVALIDVELPSLRFTLANRMARIVLGYNPDAGLPALTARDILPGDELDRILAITSEIQRQGTGPDGTYRRKMQQEIHETTGIRRDGSRFPVEFQSMFLLDSGGLPAGARIMFRDISERKAAEVEREKLLAELQAAVASVRKLEGLLPVCAWCRKVRDDRGYWNEIESYIQLYSDARLSHGICPDCARQFDERIQSSGRNEPPDALA